MSKELKRILLINSEFPPICGGGGIYTSNLAFGLAFKYSNLDVHVLAGQTKFHSHQAKPKKILKNLTIWFSKSLYLIDQGLAHLWQVAADIQNVVNTISPDLIHSQHTYESLGSLIVKQTGHFKLIITIQKSPVTDSNIYISDPCWNVIRFCYQNGNYDGVIVNSKAYQELAEKLYAHNPIKLIYYGIDKDNFFQDEKLRQTTRKKLKINANDLLILCPARIDERKGIDILIKSLTIVNQKLKLNKRKIKVILPGAKVCLESEKYNLYLIKLINRLKLSDQVILSYGEGRYDQMNRLYNASDIVVLPSLREGLGFSIIEAMKIVKPVIVSNTIGLNELVKNKVNGLLFRVGDHQDLAEKIIHLISNPEITEKLAQSGYIFQKDKFTISQMTKEHYDFYQDIFNSKC